MRTQKPKTVAAFPPDPAPRLAAFLAAYGLGTLPDPSFAGNRTWRQNHLVFFHLRRHEGRLWVDFIGSRDPGKGHGSRGLKWLCALADAHAVSLYLTVFGLAGLDRRYLTNEALTAWYRRNGFQTLASTDGKPTMLRRPQAAGVAPEPSESAETA